VVLVIASLNIMSTDKCNNNILEQRPINTFTKQETKVLLFKMRVPAWLSGAAPQDSTAAEHQVT